MTRGLLGGRLLLPGMGSSLAMEFGAFFILVIFFAVVGVLGGGVYAIAVYLRGQKLSPEGDKLDEPEEDQPPPEHLQVETEQKARFVGSN